MSTEDKPLKTEIFFYLKELHYHVYTTKVDGEERAREQVKDVLTDYFKEDENAINQWLEYFDQEASEYKRIKTDIL